MQKTFLKVSRFLFLNIWSFTVGLLGGVALFTSVSILIRDLSKWAGSAFFALAFLGKVFYVALFIVAFVGLKVLSISQRLFSSYPYKKREIALLINRNKANFRAGTFDMYMAAPCGRLVVRVALYKLGKSGEYRNLLKRRKPFFKRVKDACTPQKVIIYSKDDFDSVKSIKG